MRSGIAFQRGDEIARNNRAELFRHLYISCKLLTETVLYTMIHLMTTGEAEMTELTILALIGLAAYILGFKMGHAVGMNDGLRRAHEMMNKAHR